MLSRDLDVFIMTS